MSGPVSSDEIGGWEAGYDNLAPDQRAEFDRLMTIPTNQWPTGLIQHIRDTGGPLSGDALADAVGRWVKAGGSAGAEARS